MWLWMMKSTPEPNVCPEPDELLGLLEREVRGGRPVDIHAVEGVVAELDVVELAELDGAIALVDPAAHRCDGLIQVRGNPADRRVHGHAFVHDPTEEGVNRHPERLALDVPERDVEAADHRHRRPAAAPPLAALVHPVPEGVRLEGILPDEVRNVVVDERRDGLRCEVADDDLAESADACIRLDPDQGAALVPAADVGPLLVDRGPVGRQQVRGHAGDLHRGLLGGSRPVV